MSGGLDTSVLNLGLVMIGVKVLNCGFLLQDKVGKASIPFIEFCVVLPCQHLNIWEMKNDKDHNLF